MQPSAFMTEAKKKRFHWCRFFQGPSLAKETESFHHDPKQTNQSGFRGGGNKRILKFLL